MQLWESLIESRQYSSNEQLTPKQQTLLTRLTLSSTSLSLAPYSLLCLPSQYFTYKELTRFMVDHLSVLSDGMWQRMHMSSGLSSQTEEDRQVSPWLPINKHYLEWVITKQPKKIIPGVSFSQQQGKVKMKRKHLNTWLKGLGYTFLPSVELRLATLIYQVLPMEYK